MIGSVEAQNAAFIKSREASAANSVEAQNAAFIKARESGKTTGSSSTSGASASQTQLSSDVNFFLKMLTTQLKNQDPTQPLDTNEFTQQIATYSGVQQQVNANSNLEKLLAATKQSSISTAVSYLNREVEVKGSTGEVVGGQGAFSYILPQTAGKVKITIKNAAGSEVYSGNGATRSGRNLVVWDGVNGHTGQREPDGLYTIVVEATDAAGKAITAETRSVAIISGLENEANGDVTLTSATSQKIKFTDILAVRAPTRTAADSNSGT